MHAVLGNNDSGLCLAERLTIDVAGCEAAMVHYSGPAIGRGRRLRRWFADADLVVFGHSHLPWYEVDVRSADERPAPAQPGFCDAAPAGPSVHRRPG